MAITVREIRVVVRVAHNFSSLTPMWVPTAVSNMAPSVTLQNNDALFLKTKPSATKALP